MAFLTIMVLIIVITVLFVMFNGYFGGYIGLELLSTLIFVGGMGLVIASRDPLLISLLALLLFKRVSYEPPVDIEYDYRSVRFGLEHQ